MGCRVLAIANQKGGVGKTTTSINLASALSVTNKRVLMIDLDPQGNATVGSGIDKSALNTGIYEVLMSADSVDDARTQTAFGYDLLGSNSDLTAAEVELLKVAKKEYRLRDMLAPVKVNYDYILIDCPPALNILTLNALVASDTVLIPMQCEYYALEGLASLVTTIESVRQYLNPKLKIDGLLRTMFDARNSLSNDVSRQLIQHFKEQVYRSVIPRNVRLAEAPSYGEPVIVYDPRSKGALAYLALAGELIRREQQQSKVTQETERVT